MSPGIDSKELTAATSTYTCVPQVLKCNLRVRFCDYGPYKSNASVLIYSRISTCLVFFFPRSSGEVKHARLVYT